MSRGNTRSKGRHQVTKSARGPQLQTVMARGRRIHISECAFVFNRIWTVTCTHQHEEEGDEKDHAHKMKNEIMLTDLFHIVHLAGKLLNKAEPADDDETPFEQF